MALAGTDPRLSSELPAYLAEVAIACDDVPACLPDAVVRGVLYEASRTDVLLEVPDIARLHIRRDAITVQPLRSDCADALGPYLRRTPLMALVFMRGGFGASAAVVAGPDGAAVLVGRTVSGKSTLAAALMKRGLRLMADDVAPVFRDGRVFPVWPEMVLWQDAVDALFEGTPSWLGPAEGEPPRRAIAGGRFCEHPMPIKRFFELRPGRLEGGFGRAAERALMPYQPELAAALTAPFPLLTDTVRTLAFPQASLAEMDELAAQIMADCGWPADLHHG